MEGKDYFLSKLHLANKEPEIISKIFGAIPKCFSKL